MCTQTIPLPQIRRISSGEVREEWKRMTNSQRRLSYDYKICETNTIKSKSVLKIQKISTTKQLINNSEKKLNNNSGIRVKSSIGRISLNASKAVPLFGDHQTLLDGSQLLELVNKFQYNDSNYGTNEIIKINSKRYQLERVLQMKCKSCIRDDCLSHLIKSNALIRDLREIFFEDFFKLNFIKTNKTDEKRKLKVLDSFVKNCSIRTNISETIDQKSSSWISMVTNANRLMNVTHIRPNDDGLELVLQKTIKELKHLRLSSLNLFRIIFEINIEIMSLLIDLIPFECISQICNSIDKFNQLLVCHQITPLDLISVVALNQSKVTTNKFLYYLYNEINKNFELIRQNNNQINCCLRSRSESEDITSDYFSASSISLTNNRKIRSSGMDSKYAKDFKIVFNILIQSNQRILLKIIFGYQDKTEQTEVRSSGNRQKWFKTNGFSHQKQQQICRQIDKHFWELFWLQFDYHIRSAICFCDINNISLPISVLCNPSKAMIVHSLLKAFIKSEELLEEAIKSLESSNQSIINRLSLYNYSQNYKKFLNYLNKSVLTVEKRETYNRVGTTLGFTLIDCIEPLIENKIKLNQSLNENEIIVDNILTNILNLFTTFVETKQSLELDFKFIEFICLSILDIKNLMEIITSIETKKMKEFIKVLKNIKENALIKSKDHVFQKTYGMISKFMPFKDYRRKICSTNSEWIEKIIASILQPIIDLVSNESSFEANILRSDLIEEFNKAFLNCVLKENRILIKFSHSGAVQFNQDVNTYWDWMVNNNIQSTDLSSIIKLKSLSSSLANRETANSSVIIRPNRINPEMPSFESNQNDLLQNIQYNNRRKYLNCFPFVLCSP